MTIQFVSGLLIGFLAGVCVMGVLVYHFTDEPEEQTDYV